MLCHAYGERLNDGDDGVRFMVMRLARLWPLHLAVLALFVGLELAKLAFSRAATTFALDSQAFAPGHSLWEIVTNVLFLQSFGLHSGLTWNGPAWSAALEFHVSILFAFVVLLFPRRRYDVFLALCLGGRPAALHGLTAKPCSSPPIGGFCARCSASSPDASSMICAGAPATD